MKSITVFIVHAYWTTMNLSIEFLAPTRYRAIKAGLAWVKNREKELKDLGTLTTIKVWTKQISPPSRGGYIRTFTTGCIFEWKYDWPGSLEDYFSNVSRVLRKRKRF